MKKKNISSISKVLNRLRIPLSQARFQPICPKEVCIDNITYCTVKDYTVEWSGPDLSKGVWVPVIELNRKHPHLADRWWPMGAIKKGFAAITRSKKTASCMN